MIRVHVVLVKFSCREGCKEGKADWRQADRLPAHWAELQFTAVYVFLDFTVCSDNSL